MKIRALLLAIALITVPAALAAPPPRPDINPKVMTTILDTARLALRQLTSGQHTSAAVTLRRLDALLITHNSSLVALGVVNSRLGESLWMSGKLDEAAERFALALEQWRRSGNEHLTPQIAAITNNLALMKHAQGKFAEAEHLYREALTRLTGVASADKYRLAIEANLALLKDNIDDSAAFENDEGHPETASVDDLREEFFGQMAKVVRERSHMRIVGRRLIVQSDSLFGSGSALIEIAGRTDLRLIAEGLRQAINEAPANQPWRLWISGHTDRRPIRTEEFPSNWSLSRARAQAVKSFLISQGIPEQKIETSGYADVQPIDDRQDEMAYKRNRRIEISIEPDNGR